MLELKEIIYNVASSHGSVYLFDFSEDWKGLCTDYMDFVGKLKYK